MDEKKLVLDADDRFFAGLNQMFAGNLEPIKQLWSHADDVVYMSPIGDVLIGWEAVLPSWVAQASLELGGDIKPVERHVTADHGLAVVHHRANGWNKDGDGNRVDFSLRGTNVYRKEADEWRLIAHHADPLPFLQASADASP